MFGMMLLALGVSNLHRTTRSGWVALGRNQYRYGAMRTPISGFRSRILILGCQQCSTQSVDARPTFLEPFSPTHRYSLRLWPMVEAMAIAIESLAGVCRASSNRIGTSVGRTPDDAALYAIVTDVGNDLMYDAAPAQVFDWVRGCVDQIVAHRRFDTSQLVISGLPMERARAIRAFSSKFSEKFFSRKVAPLGLYSDPC